MNTQYRVAAHFLFFCFSTRGPSTIFLPFIFAAFQRCEAIGGILSQQLYMGLFSLYTDFFFSPLPLIPFPYPFPTECFVSLQHFRGVRLKVAYSLSIDAFIQLSLHPVLNSGNHI